VTITTFLTFWQIGLDLSCWQVMSIAVLILGESKADAIHNQEFAKFPRYRMKRFVD
jgi:hypothetical protein